MVTATAYSIPKVPGEVLDVLEKGITSASQQAIEGWEHAIRAQQKLTEAIIEFWFQAVGRQFVK